MKIFYFTATGNSLAVAKKIGGELISIPQGHEFIYPKRKSEAELNSEVAQWLNNIYLKEM